MRFGTALLHAGTARRWALLATDQREECAEVEKEISDLIKKEMTLQDVYSLISKEENSFLVPNMKKIVLLVTLSPVGNAVVERLFRMMNITKTAEQIRRGNIGPHFKNQERGS